MKLLCNSQNEVHIVLDLTNVEQLHDQLLNFPAAPCWIKTTIDGTNVTVSATNNIGHE